MNIKIFISHKQEDSNKAKKIAQYIKNEYKFDTYVDILDNKINSTTNITERIVGKLRETTHLLVIFSEHTEKSMWVPFELGVSYERNQGIGVLLWADSYLEKDKLPEYLNNFPVMNSKKKEQSFCDVWGNNESNSYDFKVDDLNKYLNQIKEKEKSESMITQSYTAESDNGKSNYAKVFIHELKEQLS